MRRSADRGEAELDGLQQTGKGDRHSAERDAEDDPDEERNEMGRTNLDLRTRKVFPQSRHCRKTWPTSGYRYGLDITETYFRDELLRELLPCPPLHPLKITSSESSNFCWDLNYLFLRRKKRVTEVQSLGEHSFFYFVSAERVRAYKRRESSLRKRTATGILFRNVI